MSAAYTKRNKDRSTLKWKLKREETNRKRWRKEAEQRRIIIDEDSGRHIGDLFIIFLILFFLALLLYGILDGLS